MKDHLSDCATNNEPAYPAGECDCTFVERYNQDGEVSEKGELILYEDYEKLEAKFRKLKRAIPIPPAAAQADAEPVAPVEHMFVVRQGKTLCAAYPTKVQADCYASNFSKPDEMTVTMELLTPLNAAQPTDALRSALEELVDRCYAMLALCHGRIHCLPRTSDSALAKSIENLRADIEAARVAGGSDEH